MFSVPTAPVSPHLTSCRARMYLHHSEELFGPNLKQRADQTWWFCDQTCCEWFVRFFVFPPSSIPQITAMTRSCVETWSTSCSSFPSWTTASCASCAASWPAWPRSSRRAGAPAPWPPSSALTSSSKTADNHWWCHRVSSIENLKQVQQWTSVIDLSPLVVLVQPVYRRRGPTRPGIREQSPGGAAGQPGGTFRAGGRRRLHHQWLQLHQRTGSAFSFIPYFCSLVTPTFLSSNVCLSCFWSGFFYVFLFVIFLLVCFFEHPFFSSP